MKLLTADLWSYIGKASAICITTNGCIKSDKTAVMGKGIAYQAAIKYPGIAEKLGNSLLRYGNRVCILDTITPPDSKWFEQTQLVAFPTKPGYEQCNDASLLCKHMQATKLPARVPGWAFKSPPDLIEQSLLELQILANAEGWISIVLPLPGVGNGELPEEESIKLVSVLDDRFIVLRR